MKNWTNPQTSEKWKTFTIITTLGNDFFRKPHNNPKLKKSRIPAIIITEDKISIWLNKKSAKPDLSNLFHTKNHPK